MNYEQKYKEALKVIGSLYNVVRYQSSSDALLTFQTLEKAFPELKESEDEQHRKWIEEAHRIGWEYSKHYDPLLSKESWCEMAALDMAYWLEKQGEQKPTWSEEDERISNAIYESLDFLVLKSFGLNEDDVVNWFKSLNHQNHWKPTEEQIDALRIAAEVGTANNSWAMEKLKELYNDLQKI